MRDLTALAIAETCSIVCATAAFVLAYNGVSGWGWFLLVACLTTVTSFRPSGTRKGD